MLFVFRLPWIPQIWNVRLSLCVGYDVACEFLEVTMLRYPCVSFSPRIAACRLYVQSSLQVLQELAKEL